MTPAEYIWERCPGRPPTDRETADVLAWCEEWARDTFGDSIMVEDDYDHVSRAITPLQLLRGCDRHIEGGLAFVLGDVRRQEVMPA